MGRSHTRIHKDCGEYIGSYTVDDIVLCVFSITRAEVVSCVVDCQLCVSGKCVGMAVYDNSAHCVCAQHMAPPHDIIQHVMCPFNAKELSSK
jgi:hypothetical protein